MKKFEHLGRSLTKAEQKKIMGGPNEGGGGCSGIIECPTLGNGVSCGEIENGKCVCTHRTNGDKLCL